MDGSNRLNGTFKSVKTNGPTADLINSSIR